VGSALTLWLMISIIALLIDIVTNAFIFVWFTIGGIVAIILLLLNFSFIIQAIVFLIVSVILLAIGYPLARKTIKKTVNKTFTMEENYIGRKIRLEQDVFQKASIKIDGIYWTVFNKGEPLNKGDLVIVIGIEGNKIIIKKVEEE
jgi:membrane protein implicated in regulation of membrane protease activity